MKTTKLSGLVVGSAITALGLVAGFSVARADGMVRKGMPVYDAPQNWSGIYFGGNAGYAWSSYDNTYFVNGSQFSVDSNVGTLGFQIGLQHQFGQLVVGIEGSGSWALEQKETSAQCPNPATTCSGVFNNVFTVGPRLGWAMGKYMPYVTGGYANAAFDHTVVSKAVGIATRLAYDRTDGWYIGGGVDMALGSGWTLGLEYRHYELNDFVSERSTTGGVIDPGDRANVSAGLDMISLRLNWKLNREETVPLK